MKKKEYCFSEKFVNGKENIFTEFTYSLLYYKSFRELFAKFIFEELDVVNRLSFTDFQTQILIEDCGRPDIYVNNSEIEALIEVKITNTDLTDNQKEDYLKYLENVNDDKLKYLCFIVPLTYKNLDDCKSIKQHIGKNNGSNIKVKRLFWDDFLKAIEMSEIGKLNLFLYDYQLLLNHLLKYEKINFTSKIINFMHENTIIPEAIEEIVKLIGNVSKETKKDELTMREAHHKDFSVHGFYLLDKDDDEILFFGCSLDSWKETDSPLAIELLYNDEEYIEQFKTICKATSIGYYEFEKDGEDCYLGVIPKEMFNNKMDISMAEIVKRFSEIMVKE